MNFYAHSAEDENGESLPENSGKWQLLSVHLHNTKILAKKFSSVLGTDFQSEAELAGMLHDLGKYSTLFKKRLNGAAISINHWSAGAMTAWKLGRVAAALSIEGHHSGIPALHGNSTSRESGMECWKQRLIKLSSPTSASAVNHFPETIEELLNRFSADHFTLPKSILLENPAGREFIAAMRVRFLFSCLVDADFLDTEQHFNSTQAALRDAPVLDAKKSLSYLRTFLNAKPSNGDVNQLRRRLLNDCLHAAERSPGLFTLTAPTGSGKTLASLAFALRHIEHHNANLSEDSPQRLRRIIVVIPYTSIIEQTAAVYRSVFESAFGENFVLEHHSAVAQPELQGDYGKDAESLRLRHARLASENWDAPLVVTTTVQFFESLFSNRPSKCRKLHNITRSVILFDEVQTLPRDKVPSLLSGVRWLTQEPCGSTAVFMTATQPAFDVAAHLIDGGWNPVEISSAPKAMAEAFKRVQITRKPNDWRPTWGEVADCLRDESQFLVVVNTKASARALFEALPHDGNTFHLSTSLCAAHRQEILKKIKTRLNNRQPCRLVSTQLIEAGVDVDFPVVWRAQGPLDSIIQTAGRCNREGRLPQPGKVTVFRPAEDGMPPGAYAQAAAVTNVFLDEHSNVAWHQPETYSEYFRQLYGISGPQKPEADEVYEACKKFDFPLAAEKARLIVDDTRGVLVPWGEGIQLIKEIKAQYHCEASLFRRCQRFTINLYVGQFEKAKRTGVITSLTPDETIYYWTSKYDENLGATHHEAEDLVV